MISTLSQESVEFGTAVARALRAAGGVDVLRRYAVAPAERAVAITALLEPLGVWELNPRESQEEFEAAAAVCRAAGAVALPFPVAERLSRPEDAEGVVLVQSQGRRTMDHGDLTKGWVACDLRGNGYDVTSVGSEPRGTRLGTFVADVEVEARGTQHLPDVSTLLTLQGWWLLGLLDQALTDTTRYAGEREQFGRTLTRFQSVGFRLADMSVAVQKLEELAKYTLWSVIHSDETPAYIDSLALRVAALESAEIVLRGSHQVHGAMGFCDETDVSWLSRASQGVRRLPEGRTQTNTLLTEHISQAGFSGPFANHGGH